MNSYHNKSYRSRDTCQSYSRRSRCTFAWHNHHTEESVCNLHNTTGDISHNYPASCLHSHSHNFDINASSIRSKCVDRFQTDFLHLESMAFPHHAPTDRPSPTLGGSWTLFEADQFILILALSPHLIVSQDELLDLRPRLDEATPHTWKFHMFQCTSPLRIDSAWWSEMDGFIEPRSISSITQHQSFQPINGVNTEKDISDIVISELCSQIFVDLPEVKNVIPLSFKNC